MPTAALVLVAVAVVLGAASVLAELVGPKTQAWTIAHPVAVTVATGLILLVLTVFVVERWIAWNESRLWRTPALAAIDAYVSRALDVHSKIHVAARRLIGEEPPWDEQTDRAVIERLRDAALGDTGVGYFRSLREVILGEMSELGVIGLLTMQTVARHQPFEKVVEAVAAEQARLSYVADRAHAADALTRNHDDISEKEAAVGADAEAIWEGLYAFQSQMVEIQNQVGAARRAQAKA